MTPSVARQQFVQLMTGLRNFGLRQGDPRFAGACDTCVSRVTAAAADCPLGTFYAQTRLDHDRWTAPPPVAGKVPIAPRTPASMDGATALNFVHKGLCDKALMTGDSKYLAALRACRWHRNTSATCPMYRDYLQGVGETAAGSSSADDRT